MVSKWNNLKAKATRMRNDGNSIGSIESSVKIPRSTLSGWFRNISLSEKQKAKLMKNQLNALKIARVNAAFNEN